MKSALDAALTYLSRRALTHYELQVRLEKKGYSETEIKEALSRVEGWGYVNDRELALSVAQDKGVSNSRQQVKQELLKRGIGPLIVEETLERVFEPDQELVQCADLAKKLWLQEGKRWETTYRYKKTYAHFSREHFLKQKIGQKLAQKGYPLEVIYQAMEEVSKAAADD